MTDITAALARPAAKVDVASHEARRRIARRYRAERRFKFCGLAAVALTSVFLVVLFADILRNGMPAFFQHSLKAEVAVDKDVVSPSGRNDVTEIRGADYFPIMRDTLLKLVPGVEGRGPQRKLTQLLSSGAADDLRDTLAADPKRVGTAVKTRLLLSDDADLYFKGDAPRIVSRTPRVSAVVSATSGEVTVKLGAPDLAQEVASVRRILADRAAALSAEADRIARASGGASAEKVTELRNEAATRVAESRATDGLITLDDRMPSLLAEINGGRVKITRLSATEFEGETLLALTDAETAAPGNWRIISYATPEADRKMSDLEVAILEKLRAGGIVERHFNWRFLTAGDSREPELAGIRGALVGSILTLFVTLVLCVPVGVLAAVYLEEFAPKNRLTDLIEVNINNLAAVPSIVFGLLGLAVFLNFFGMPRSVPLVGGLVLALLVLPTIIIASRAALKAVPPSIKEAALGVGASHQQAVFHHVLPLAMPGIMTGTIIGMAHALGETAPLLMIGMVAFIVDVPSSIHQAATVLPVQIFLWSDLPEPAFRAKTAAAIMVLLAFLFVMNGLAIWVRRKFERRW